MEVPMEWRLPVIDLIKATTKLVLHLDDLVGDLKKELMSQREKDGR